MSAPKRKLRNNTKIAGVFIGIFLLLSIVSIYLFPQVRQFLADQVGLTKEVKGSSCHLSGDIILITDTSYSMNGAPLQKAVDAAKNFVDIVASFNTPSPSDHIGLVTFDDTARLNNQLTTTYNQVKTSLDGLGKTVLNTCTQCGIDTAAQEISKDGRPNTPKIGILLTDGRANFIEGWPSDHGEDPSQGEAAANTAVDNAHASMGMRFYTIGLGNGINQGFLQSIADRTGGDYYHSPGLGQLQNIYQDIAQSCPPPISPPPSGSPFPTTTPSSSSNSISGNIYVDYVNQDSFIQPPDTLYDKGTSVIDVYDTSKKKKLITETTTQTGQYSTGTLNPGTYIVEYTSLPQSSGYFMAYPRTGPPPAFQVTVGDGCDPGNENDGYCAKGSAKDVNFGITNIKPWYQSSCGDLRIDGSMKSADTINTGVTDPIPLNPVCGSSTPAPYVISCQSKPGIVFSGDNSYDFGKGYASSKNYIAGGNNPYPEVFSPVNKGIIRTSYNYMLTTAKQSGLVATELDDHTSSRICNLSDCNLPSKLSHGLYHADGTLYLNGFTTPNKSDYVLLVDGDLYIQQPIIIPANSQSTFTVSVSGNIYVSPNVGNSDPTDTTDNLDGFYSADKSFIIQSNGLSCASGNSDNRLNIGGTVIVNAGQQNPAGIFENDRNLCIGNFSCPVVSFIERPDLLLNTPTFVKHTSSLFQEVAP